MQESKDRYKMSNHTCERCNQPATVQIGTKDGKKTGFLCGSCAAEVIRSNTVWETKKHL